MRILLFHPLTGHLWRGIERTVVCLASSLADLGHESSILTLHSPHRALLDGLHPGVRLHGAPRSRYLAYNLAIPYHVAHLACHQYDAVIVFFGGFGVGPALAAARRIRSIPTYLCPCYPVELAPHRYDEFERFQLPQTAAGIWAAGDHVARQAEVRFGRPVVGLPQGVDIGRFTANAERGSATRRELRIEESAPVLLTVAALEQRKGIQRVLQALPGVLRSYPNARYLVAGEGEYGSELRGMIAELGLAGIVTLLGPWRHVEDLYRAADVFCLLSEGEANPMVIYEAMSCKIPLVTLGCPPFPDVLDSESAAMLSDSSPAAVATCLINLLSDGNRRTAMGRAGRELVERRYSFDRVSHQIVQLIEADRETAVSAPGAIA